jgi:branched-chain amino acid transport system ATP-binding protein
VTPLLEVERIGRVFGGVPALADVSFEMPDSGVHAIIGPNGAGKTTLLNLLSGVYAPTSGSVEIDGVSFNGRPPHEFAAAGIARTFQTPQVFFNMTALENVEVGSHLHRTRGLAQVLLRLPRFRESERAGADEAASLMREVGLADWVDRPADALPYGALKRLEIARALALRPRLLLLDEPAAGLNPNEAGELGALIRTIAGRGITVVLVEHNMRLVMSLADTILVLDHGTRLAAGTPAQVRADPHVIQAYLGADEQPDARD